HLGDVSLAGILEASLIQGIWHTIRIILIHCQGDASGISDRDDRALVIRVQITPAGLPDSGAFVPNHGAVPAQSIHVAAKQIATAVVLARDPIAIVAEGSYRRAARGLIEPPERIIAERSIVGAAGHGQMILHIVCVCSGAIGGEISPGIPGVRRTTY